MKNSFGKIIFVLCVFCCSALKAQTALSYTLDAYVDANNNFVHDAGEVFLTQGYNLIDVTSPYACGGIYGNTTSYGNCPGALITGNIGNVNSCNMGNNVTNLYNLGAYIQPIPTVNNFTIQGNNTTVTNIPLKPTILNQAFIAAISGAFKNSNMSSYGVVANFQAGIVDTASSSQPFLCSNSNLDFVTNTFMVVNLVNCSNLKTVFNIKIDNTVVDTYSFTGGAANNYSTYPTTNGFFQTWYASVLPYNASFSYSLVNYPMPSPGYHTFSIESVPVSMAYTATTVMKTVFYVNDCGNLGGNAFVDCDNNCTKQPTEYYPNYNVAGVLMTSASNTINASPDLNGNYTINAPVGLYTVTPYTQASYSLCNAASFTNAVTSNSSYTFNMAIQEVSVVATDFGITHFLSGANPGPGAVPGGTITVSANNYRQGSACATLTSPTAIKIVLAPELTFVSSIGNTPAPSAIINAISGDTLVWNNPAPNGFHKFTAVTATNAVIGNSYCIRSLIYPLADGLTANNSYTTCRVFGGPFDPNSKSSDAPGMLANGDIMANTPDLTYFVQFQNLGNGAAVNVNIKDTIDVNLDLSSLQILSSSAPVQMQVNANSRLVEFKFRDINLPSSALDEPGSHGFVQYRVNLNSGLPLGTSIKNRARIYFDYNSAVLTNQTVNTIPSPLAIKEYQAVNGVLIYPNPAGNLLTVQSKNTISKIELFTITGQLMLAMSSVNSDGASIDVSMLTGGIYFLRVESTTGISMQKLIKE